MDDVVECEHVGAAVEVGDGVVAVAARQIEIGEAEDVFAGTTLQRVVAGEAGKEIVARTAAEAVRRTVYAEHHVASTAAHVLPGHRLLGKPGNFNTPLPQQSLHTFPPHCARE